MSNPIPQFRAKNLQGVLHFISEYSLKEYLLTLPSDVVVTIKKYFKQRSSQQNRFFHGVIVPMVSEKTGYSFYETKDLLKGLFLSEEITKTLPNGEEFTVIIVRGTSTLNTVEQEEFNDKIREWAFIKLDGLIIPYPNEVDF